MMKLYLWFQKWRPFLMAASFLILLVVKPPCGESWGGWPDPR